MNNRSIIFFALIMAIFIDNSFADQNFSICLEPRYARGLTLEYNPHDSGCVIGDDTESNFRDANRQLASLYSTASAATNTPSNHDEANQNDSIAVPIPPDFGMGTGPAIMPGSNYLNYTVVFESSHTMLGIVEEGNCNIHLESSEMANIDVKKDDQVIGSFACYHPGHVTDSFCQQVSGSDAIGMVFSAAQSDAICSGDSELNTTLKAIIYRLDH